MQQQGQRKLLKLHHGETLRTHQALPYAAVLFNAAVRPSALRSSSI
jgi:hypothetical protein